MDDSGKTNDQLVGELIKIRQRVTELETSLSENKQTIDELESLYQQHRMLFDLAPDGFYINDLKGVFIDGNIAAENITGYEKNELIGKNFLKINLLPLNQIPKAARLLAFSARGKPTGPDEFTLNRKNGDQIEVEIRTYPITIQGKKRILGIARDIRERKIIERDLEQSRRELEMRVQERTAELQRSNDKLKAEVTERKKYEDELSLRAQLLDNASDAISLLNTDGELVYVNDIYSKVHGFSKEELTGMNIRQIDEPLNDEWISWLENELEENGVAVFDKIHTRKDGTTVELEVRARRIVTGSSQFILSVERDITERQQAAIALRESEEFNSSLLRNSPNPIVVFNTDTSIRYVNPAFEKITGYLSQELIGKKAPYPYWGTHTDQEDVDRLTRHIQHGIEEFEAHLTRKDGEQFRVRVKNVPVMIGEVVEYAIANWVDITETKKAEEALRESEERYRTLVQHAPIGITISTEDGEILDANKVLLDIHGCNTLDEYKEIPVSKRYFDPEDRKQWLNILHHQGMVKGYEAQCLRKDGSAFWASISSISQTPASTGKTFIVAVQDITERKQAEDALRSSEEKYRGLVNNINLGIFRSTPDTDGRFLEVNPAMETITGYSREELLNLNVVKLYRNPAERKITVNKLESSWKPVTQELRFVKKDGGEIIVLDTKSPVRNDSGEIMYFDGILEDITLRKSLEEERQKLDKLESLGVLAGGIAHDFNNLLTGIMGNISLAMMEVDENSGLYMSLQEADKASERARDLTQQLLTFSRGGAPIKKATSLASLITDNTNFIIRGTGIIAEYDIPEDLWMVDVDSGQISQVITNIVINARDVMPDGGSIRIKGCNEIIQERNDLPLNAGKYVKISISDTGIGIQEKFLARIFDPYFTTKQKGSGLGLATSYSIIKNHSGHITVESEFGEGTTFTIYLPASEKKTETRTEKVAGKNAVDTEGRILVMDDEESIRMLLSRMLTGLGYTVETTGDGEEAVRAYIQAKEKGQPFNAVILDITVPGGMGGIDAIQALLKIDPGINAVVSSGYATDSVMSEYKEYGFKAVVNKPYKAGQMKETLRVLLSGT